MENKKTLMILLFSILLFIHWNPINLYSQDTIFTTKNKIIVCKVKEVSNEIILYTSFPDTSKINSINTSSVLRILYSNGTSDVFNIPFSTEPVMDSSLSMYEQGRNYGRLNSHFGHIAIASFFLATSGTILLAEKFENKEAILAVPVAIFTIAAIPPKSYPENTETSPSNDLEFKRGYDKQRRKEKKKAALKGFTAGLLVDVIIIFFATRE